MTIVNNAVNDVAATVLPDAPIDPATGLPVPTIAVATDGGVSVITDSGAVYDSGSTLGFNNVRFDPQGGVYATRNRYGSSLLYSTQTDYTAGDGFGDTISNSISMMAGATNKNQLRVADVIFLGNGPNTSLPSRPGLMYHLANSSAPVGSFAKGMTCFTTSTYNTGWMNGDIKGAFLADTDDTDLVGSGELVTNGTFDTDTSGWTGLNATLSAISGSLVVSVSEDGLSYATQAIPTTVGRSYQYTATLVSETLSVAPVHFYLGTSAGGNQLGGPISVTGTVSGTFVATSTTAYVTVFSGSSSLAGETYTFDNISVKLADADRSVNNKGLIVNGTVTRSPVATGAELVAYSGFSSSNYLEQPYNSALDFGTGDFCVMGWAKITDFGSTNKQFIELTGTSAALYGLGIRSLATAGEILVDIKSGGSGTTLSTGYIPPLSSFVHYAVVRSSGVITVYANGSAIHTQSYTSNFTNGAMLTTIGIRYDLSGSYQAINTSLALWRISATAPTAEQIKKIYEDEKVLFQENAACTLYGTSDAVTALAHDSDTGLLHVGTSAGRSVFDGLRRIDNTTDAVTTAISASGGFILEQ